MLLPLSLSALLAGAFAVACSRRGEAPATPRPEPTSPSGMPMGGGARESNDPIDAGVDGMLAAPPAGASSQLQSLLMRGSHRAGAPTVLLASQPATPGAPPPSGAPAQPGAPSQPSPSQPSPPQPAPAQPSPTPGAPPPTGAPSQPSPSQPSPSQPSPGSPRPGSGAPGTSSGPADAGAFDAGLPQLPPIPDGGIPSDSGMQPILRRD
jgi:hypothetical protein